MTGGTVSGVEAGEQAEGGSQALLAVTAFPLDGIARQGRLAAMAVEVCCIFASLLATGLIISYKGINS